MGNLRLVEFEKWLKGHLMPGSQEYIYHRGELARDKVKDPNLQALADRTLEVSNVRADKVSKCGHVRGEIKGTGQVKLFTRREQGELAYIAVRSNGG